MATKRPRRRSSREEDGDARFYFDADAADRAVAWIETLHLRGEGGADGGKLTLMPDQRETVRAIFGWKERRTGRRRYRRVSIWKPRGNGKTPFAVAIALYVLFTSGVPAAEIYSIAADRKQAEISFEDGKHMVLSSKVLHGASRVLRRSIEYTRHGSEWNVWSSEAKTKHGFRPLVVVFDELHTQKKRELWSAVKTGLGKGSRETLLITISTAGVYDPESLGYTEYAYAKKVAAGVVEDPNFLPVIFEADPAVANDGRWATREVWAACNPGLGITIQEAVLEDEARQAKEDPAALAEFLQLRLNIWVQAAQAAILPEQYARCHVLPLLVEGPRPTAFGGMDVGEKDDLTAAALCIPHKDGTYSATGMIFMPESKAVKLSQKHGVDYLDWQRRGFVQWSGVNFVDTDDMRAWWKRQRELYDLREVGFDPWNAYRLAEQLLNEDRVKTVEIPQTMKGLSEATKEFLELVADGRFRAGENPALRWMASNLVLFRDGKGNVVPQKQSKNAKIDLVVAWLNAFSRARLQSNGPSVYETRGVIVL